MPARGTAFHNAAAYCTHPHTRQRSFARKLIHTFELAQGGAPGTAAPLSACHDQVAMPNGGQSMASSDELRIGTRSAKNLVVGSSSRVPTRALAAHAPPLNSRLSSGIRSYREFYDLSVKAHDAGAFKPTAGKAAPGKRYNPAEFGSDSLRPWSIESTAPSSSSLAATP